MVDGLVLGRVFIRARTFWTMTMEQTIQARKWRCCPVDTKFSEDDIF